MTSNPAIRCIPKLTFWEVDCGAFVPPTRTSLWGLSWQGCVCIPDTSLLRMRFHVFITKTINSAVVGTHIYIYIYIYICIHV